MKNRLKKSITFLSTSVLWWYWLFVRKNKKIYRDIDRIFERKDLPQFGSYFIKFCYAMNFLHEFPSIYYLRIGKIRFFRKILFWFYRPDSTVMIHMPESKIGKGLKLVHGFSIICIADNIGNDCSIYQQVTIGYSHGNCPTIGNNVTIYAGAKVLGGVTIGDHVVIAANAVITKSVPANAIVAGVPAKIIRYRNINEFVI